MVYFLLSLICSALVSVVMRISEKHIRNPLSMLACNYAACTVMAAACTGTAQLFPHTEGLSAALLMGLVSGALFLGAFVLLQWNIRQNGVSLPSTFMKLGVVVPTLMAVTIFGETPTWVQIAGIVLVLVSILLIQGGSERQQSVSYGGLIALLLVGGMASAMTKVYDFYGAPALKNHFLFYNFGVALLLCIALCLYKKQGFGLMDGLFGLLVGIPNYLSTLFLLLSLETVPAMVAYPTSNVGCIVLVLLCGRIFFKERLTRRQWGCVGLILLALVLLNL